MNHIKALKYNYSEERRVMFQQPARGQYREFQSDDSESEREDAPTHQILPQGTRKNRWHHIQGRVFFIRPHYFKHKSKKP